MAAEANESATRAIEDSDDSDGPVATRLSVPRLARTRTTRTAALEKVGLGAYRDALVACGVRSLGDVRGMGTSQLAAIGLDLTQQHVLRLVADSQSRGRSEAGAAATAAAPAQEAGASSMAVGTNSAAAAAAAARPQPLDLGPCCIEAEDEGCIATVQLACCGMAACEPCLRGAMVSTGVFRRCPNRECDAAIPTEIVRSIFLNSCCCCSLTVKTEADTDDVHPASDDANLCVHLQCGFDHVAHTSCLHSYIVQHVEAGRFPIPCPGGDACRCQISGHTVKHVCESKVLSVSPKPSEPVDTQHGVANKVDPVLAKFYELVYADVVDRNGFQRRCPGHETGTCAAVIDLTPGSPARRPNSQDVWCAVCQRQWCSTCWRPAHPACSCTDYQEVHARWQTFLSSMDDVAEDIMTQLRNYQALVANEEHMAQNCRHCPNCNILVEKHDGCDAMRCGYDARDKGGALRSSDGCGQAFSWTQALPYVPRVAHDKDAVVVRSSSVSAGVVVPPRLCTICWDHIYVGTVFEELSAEAQRMQTDPHSVFLNFIAKQSDVLDPSVVFAMMRARRFDSPSRPMRELNAIQRARWSAPPTDNYWAPEREYTRLEFTEPQRQVKLRMSELRNARCVTRVQLHMNSESNAGVSICVTCKFKPSLQIVRGASTTTLRLVALPMKAMPDGCGWLTVFDTAGLRTALQNAFQESEPVRDTHTHGKPAISAFEVASAMESLSKLTVHFSASAYVEGLQVFAAACVPPPLLEWLLEKHNSDGVHCCSFPHSELRKQLFSCGGSAGIGVCAKCMLLQINTSGDGVNQSTSHLQDDEVEWLGAVVKLSQRVPASQAKAVGPLRHDGTFGFVTCNCANVRERGLLVASATGQTGWYKVDEVVRVNLPEPVIDDLHEAVQLAIPNGSSLKVVPTCRIVSPRDLAWFHNTFLQDKCFVPPPASPSDLFGTLKRLTVNLEIALSLGKCFHSDTASVDFAAVKVIDFLGRLVRTLSSASHSVFSLQAECVSDSSLRSDMVALLFRVRRAAATCFTFAVETLQKATVANVSSGDDGPGIVSDLETGINDSRTASCGQPAASSFAAEKCDAHDVHHSSSGASPNDEKGSLSGREGPASTLLVISYHCFRLVRDTALDLSLDVRRHTTKRAQTTFPGKVQLDTEHPNQEIKLKPSGSCEQELTTELETVLGALGVHQRARRRFVEMTGARSLNDLAAMPAQELLSIWGVLHYQPTTNNEKLLNHECTDQFTVEFSEFSSGANPNFVVPVCEAFDSPNSGGAVAQDAPPLAPVPKLHLHQLQSLLPSRTLPPMLQKALSVCNGSASRLSPELKLWLELELSSAPEVPMWSRPVSADYSNPSFCSDPPNGPEASFMSGHSLPTIQNLQPHSFCGQLGAFVIRADLARLKNLCVLVYEKMRTRPMRSRNRSKLEYRLQTFRHVGRFVVHVGAQTAMVLLDTPISVAKDEILAFTSLISPAELALTRNADITLQSPAIATTGPFAKLERYVSFGREGDSPFDSSTTGKDFEIGDYIALELCQPSRLQRAKGVNCGRNFVAEGSLEGSSATRGVYFLRYSLHIRLFHAQGAKNLASLGPAPDSANNTSSEKPALATQAPGDNPVDHNHLEQQLQTCLDAAQSLKIERSVIGLCANWAIDQLRTRRAEQKKQDTSEHEEINPLVHLPTNHTLWLLNSNQSALCVADGFSVGDSGTHMGGCVSASQLDLFFDDPQALELEPPESFWGAPFNPDSDQHTGGDAASAVERKSDAKCESDAKWERMLASAGIEGHVDIHTNGTLQAGILLDDAGGPNVKVWVAHSKMEGTSLGSVRTVSRTIVSPAQPQLLAWRYTARECVRFLMNEEASANVSRLSTSSIPGASLQGPPSGDPIERHLAPLVFENKDVLSTEALEWFVRKALQADIDAFFAEGPDDSDSDDL